MLPIRAILFDADGVIQHANADDLPARLQRVLGFIPEDLDAFTREVFEAERPALAGQADFAEMLEPVVARRGAAGVAAELAGIWWCSIEADQAMLAVVGKLRDQGIQCALASNQQRYRAKYMGETLSYNAAFDRTFYSYQLGFTKPDIRYFEAIVAGLPFPPETVLFIDDAEENVTAAREAGFQAVQFVHPRNAHSVSMLKEVLQSFSVMVSE